MTKKKHFNWLVPQLLPGGNIKGGRWHCLNPKRSTDDKTKNFSVDLNTGQWADFAETNTKGTFIQLYSYLNDCDDVESARRLSEMVGMSDDNRNGKPVTPKPPPKSAKAVWTPIVPVPADAPSPPREHFKLGKPSMPPWAYRDAAGDILGYTCRFDKPDGDKEIWPLTFCRSEKGRTAWQWKSFEVPRPMYGLDRLTKHPDGSIIIFEGEKKADVADSLLAQHNIVALSFIGGVGQVNYSDFSVVHGRAVLLWPDNDDPGRTAMREVYAKIGDIASRVKFIHVPDDKPHKWDIADESWTAEAG